MLAANRYGWTRSVAVSARRSRRLRAATASSSTARSTRDSSSATACGLAWVTGRACSIAQYSRTWALTAAVPMVRARAIISILSKPMSGRRTGRAVAPPIAPRLSSGCEDTRPTDSPVTIAGAPHPPATASAARARHVVAEEQRLAIPRLDEHRGVRVVEVHVAVAVQRGAELHHDVAGTERLATTAARPHRERPPAHALGVHPLAHAHDVVERRGAARLHQREGRRAEDRGDHPGRRRVACLDEQAAPAVVHAGGVPRRPQRVPEVLREAPLEAAARAAGLGRHLGRHPHEQQLSVLPGCAHTA